MATHIPVNLSENSYEVIIGNDTLPQSGEFIRAVLPSGKKCALVTDNNVAPLYAETVEVSLGRAGFQVTRIVVPAGEESKSLAVIEDVCLQMIAAGLDRQSFLVALGGGVIGDLGGFVASIFHRGIPVVQIPTTVVAQVDSAVGGKTGVNSRLGKNLIGSFHQPRLVIADPATLASLGQREFNEGFAEIIKHAAIRDPSMLEAAVDVQPDELPDLIARNVKIKADIVAEDEFEKLGLRAHLNFGHTIGHAIENVAGYGRYLHGEAISLGLIAAVRLSVKKAKLPLSDGARVMAALRAFSLPTQLPDDLSTDDLLDALKRDKKFEAGGVRFVLVPELGKATVSSEITETDLREAIERLRKN